MKKLLLVILFLATPVWADVTAVKQCPNMATEYCLIVTENGGSPITARETSRLHRRALDWIAGGGQITPPDAWESTLAKAKIRRIKEIKQEARSKLTPYDWYVIRKAEAGTALPAPIQAYRAGVRQVTNDAEIAIDALTAINDVRDYKPVWPAELGE